MEEMKKDTILSVTDLHVKFTLRGSVLNVLRGVSLDVQEGESLAIVGESGSGKTVFIKTFLGMLDANGYIDGGSIRFRMDAAAGDDDFAELTEFRTEKEWLTVRGRQIAMVMQDPMTSLNPLQTIGRQLEETVLLHHDVTKAEAHRRAVELLTDVGIDAPEKRCRQYPHEFSGGMRQRAVIAIALACSPRILICDEPTTALDVTIQAQILQLIRDLQSRLNLTTIYITHDLGVVANVADRIAVMYAGDIVEVGTVDELFYEPRHPYTWALLSSLPQLGVRGQDLYSIEGTPPNLQEEIRGDAFAPRNPRALQIDFLQRPPFFDVSPTHKVRSWLMDPRAPRLEPPAAVRRLAEGRL